MACKKFASQQKTGLLILWDFWEDFRQGFTRINTVFMGIAILGEFWEEKCVDGINA